MVSKAADVATVELSTDDVPEHERVGYWREVVGRSMLRLDVEPIPGQPFRSRLTARLLPGLGILSGFMGGMSVTRTRELIADGNDDLLLPVHEKGNSLVAVRGREAALGKGDTILMTCADHGAVTVPTAVQFTQVKVPKSEIASLVPGLDDAVMRSIPRDSEALRLLAGYVKLMDQVGGLSSPGLRRLAVTHVYDLVALVIGASRDAAAIAEGRGLRAARLNAIRVDIAEHLGDGDLSVAEVAARHRVSPRYVQMLFETEGTTFSQDLRNQRLVRAHRLLSDLRSGHLTITAIAFEVGFSDLSHFNRAFRQQYGRSPSEVRAAHGGAAGSSWNGRDARIRYNSPLDRGSAGA